MKPRKAVQTFLLSLHRLPIKHFPCPSPSSLKPASALSPTSSLQLCLFSSLTPQELANEYVKFSVLRKPTKPQLGMWRRHSRGRFRWPQDLCHWPSRFQARGSSHFRYFRVRSSKLRKLADKVASAGFLVVVPDFFYGDPADHGNPNFNWEAWFKLHGTDKGFEDAKPVIAALKSKGVTAIGTAGFCWGGMVLVKLAGSEDIQAAVILHPGPMTQEEIGAVKTPTAILGAEIDNISPPEKLKKFGEMLSAKLELDSYVKIFPGVSHGWSVKYNDDDESAIKSAEEAHDDTLNWFLKHVK